MPLKGLNVLEFSGLAPVPFAGSILADFGANVIVVDKKNTFLDILLLNVQNRGKKSICVDLKHPKGIQIVEKLAVNSDIILEPYRPGVMEKLGLGPNVLMKNNPRLIYARLNGYGSYGQYSQKAGHDINFLAMSGLLSLYGQKNSKPMFPSNFSEFAGGSLVFVMGILMAVIERYKSGKGQVVDANITEGIAYTGSWLISTQNTMIWGNPRGCNVLDGGAFFYDTYETKDGKWMAVGALEPQFYKEFIEGLELNIDDMQQNDWSEKNRKIVADKFKEKNQKEWCDIFDLKDACVTPVLDIDEVNKYPHNASRNSFIQQDDIIVPRTAPKLSATPGHSCITKPIALLGQHTSEILKTIGYSQNEIKTLLETKIVYEKLKSKI